MIGQDMDHAAMTAAFEAALLTDAEMAGYEKIGKQLGDSIKKYVTPRKNPYNK